MRNKFGLTKIEILLKKFKEEYKKSKIISGGLLIAAILFLLIFVSRGLKPMNQERRLEGKILEKEIIYRTHLWDNKDEIEAEWENLQNNLTFIKTKIFSDESNEKAQLQLQQIIERIFKSRSLEIRSFRFGEVREEGDFYILPVILDFAAKYDEVLSVIYAIETYDILLRISNLDIISIYDKEFLNVKITVEGFRSKAG